MKIRLLSVSIFFWLFYLNAKAQVNDRSFLAQSILADKSLDTIQVKALKLLSGFSAGTSYSEVWIRDFNTFIKEKTTLLEVVFVKLMTVNKFD